MAYLRFVTPQTDPDSGVDSGVFQVAHALLKRGDVGETDFTVLRDTLAWFDANLQEPSRFNRTRSKGYYRRTPSGIAWFRDSATECIKRMHDLKIVLETHGYPVAIIREDRIGYVVYEDEQQVVAEPFADTRAAAH
jgi:hypothetical protein